MSRLAALLLSLALPGALATTAMAQPAEPEPPPPPGENWQDFDQELLLSSVDTMRAVMQVPGAAVVVVHREQGVVFANGFGARPDGSPVGADSRFPLGPASEVLTAVALLHLAEQGRIDLDRPVTELLPELHLAPEPATVPVTVRMLLHHRAGLCPDGGDAYDATALEAPTLCTAPGDPSPRSAVDYALLGRILETTLADDAETWPEVEVFAPTKMTQASLWPTTEPHVEGHQYVYGATVQREIPRDRRWGPSRGAEASADDLGELLLALLRAHEPLEPPAPEPAKSRRRATPAPEAPPPWPVLSKQSVDLMLTPWAGAASGDAMAWRRERIDEEDMLIADGSTATHSVAIALLPERDMGVVVLTNVNSYGAFAPRTILRAVVELLIHRQARVFPFMEFALRLCIAIMLLTGLLDVPRQLWRWRRNQFVRKVKLGPKRTARLVLGVALPIAIAVFALLIAPMKPGPLLEHQPDLVVALALGPPSWLIRAILKALNDAWEERVKRLQEEGIEGGLEHMA